MTRDDLDGRHPRDSWPGQRKDMPLPMLFLRAFPGDNGTRPVTGPFWESPDIYLLAGTAPQDAPDMPPAFGQTALADADNTVYAHVWNFGKGPALDVIVEFYWVDPSLGVTPANVHLIGQTTTSLGARGSGNCHAVVKCPEPWRAGYVNGGHECLIVRAWTLTDDRLGVPEWDASLNRHVGQRNIQVMSAAEAAAANPISLRVGPLYGANAVVQVDRIAPHGMPWLQLHTGERGRFPAMAPVNGNPQLSTAHTIGSSARSGGGSARQEVSGDDQQVAFSSNDAPPAPGEAHVYRVSAVQGGAPVGGYTIVITG